MNGRLRGEETMTIDDELVSLRDAAKDSGIVDDEAIAIRTRSSMKEQASGESGEPTTDNNAIVYFPCFGYVSWSFVVLTITYSMRVLDDLIGVASRGFVVALSGVASPGRTDFTN